AGGTQLRAVSAAGDALVWIFRQVPTIALASKSYCICSVQRSRGVCTSLRALAGGSPVAGCAMEWALDRFSTTEELEGHRYRGCSSADLCGEDGSWANSMDSAPWTSRPGRILQAFRRKRWLAALFGLWSGNYCVDLPFGQAAVVA